MLLNIYISNKCCSSEVYINQIILKKNLPHCNTTIFLYDKKGFLSTKSECFLKEHVTLKSDAMMLTVMASKNYIYIQVHLNKF